MKVSTVEEMRTCDRRAIEEFGIPDLLLMENAGQAAYYVIQREFGTAGVRFAVLCGTGNNGGDGLVVARKLHSSGAMVTTFVLGDPKHYKASARAHYEMLAKSGAELRLDPAPEEVSAVLEECDAVVDGILGTGLARDVEGPLREVIERVNAVDLPVISLDIPSGVDGDSGAVHGVAIRADATVTFGLPKRGNLLYPGASYGGDLYVSHISFPPVLLETAPIAVEIAIPAQLPERPANGHKGTFGDVLFVAGAASYFGAPSLSALAMLKAGGGYARLATPQSVAPALAALASEVVFAPQEETEEGTLALRAADAIGEIARSVDLVVLGPGVSLHEETQELVRRLAAGIDRPLLLDGDGITAVAADPAIVRARTRPTILTPHAGEMARLRGCTVGRVLEDPIAVLQDCAADLRAVVVLKGAHSLVGFPDGRVFINTSGNSGMASAGSGDVLTGSIAAMCGLGLELEDAVRTGVFLHGLAGDLAAEEKGEDGITARDILEALPAATRTCRDGYEELVEDFYGAVEVV